MKRNDVIVCVLLLLLFGTPSYVKLTRSKPLKCSKLNNKSYPVKHWINKKSNACVNCVHSKTNLYKHWENNNLYCGNCKNLHKGRMSTHYRYDEVIICINCGHKDLILNTHKDFNINCLNCKKEHE